MSERYLVVEVVEARSLSPSDVNGWADPFAKVYLNNSSIGKTKYISRTLNPQWKETFHSKKRIEAVDTLFVKIYDHDSFSTNDLIGQVKIELPAFNDGKWSIRWYRLYSDDEYKIKVRGYVCLKIQFVHDVKDAFKDEDHDTQPEIEDAEKRKQMKIEAAHKREALVEQHKQMTANQTVHNEEFRQQQYQNQQQRKVDPTYVPGISPQAVNPQLIPQAPLTPGMQPPPAPPNVQYPQQPTQIAPGVYTYD